MGMITNRMKNFLQENNFTFTTSNKQAVYLGTRLLEK